MSGIICVLIEKISDDLDDCIILYILSSILNGN